MRLRASALLYAITFSIILLITTLLLVSTLYSSQISFIEIKRIERVHDNVESAINKILLEPGLATSFAREDNSLAPTSVTIMDLYGDEKELVEVSHCSWGMLEAFSLRANVGNMDFRKNFFMGFDPERNYAVKITGTDRVLNIGGNSSINGDVFIPGGIFKRAYIEGKGGGNGNPITGNVFAVGSISDAGWIQRKGVIQDFFSYSYLTSDVNISTDSPNVNSFSNEMRFITSSAVINLSGIKIRGKYVIRSSQMIEVPSSCHLEDVILIAPEVIVRKGFRGSMQVFARKKIELEEGVVLLYPSVLGIIQEEDTSSVIFMAEGSKVGGQVFVFQKNRYNKKPMLIICKETQIHGQVFSEGITQLEGKINGNISTGSFYLKTASAVYDNTLLEAEINVTGLCEHYLSFYPGNEEKKGIVKWLQ